MCVKLDCHISLNCYNLRSYSRHLGSPINITAVKRGGILIILFEFSYNYIILYNFLLKVRWVIDDSPLPKAIVLMGEFKPWESTLKLLVVDMCVYVFTCMQPLIFTLIPFPNASL